MKKAYLPMNTSDYSLSYSNISSLSSPKNTKKDALLSAYLLDYPLSHSNISLAPYSVASDMSVISNYTLFNSDNTIYQDSYNNYLFSLSTTSITSNFNAYNNNLISTNGRDKTVKFRQFY